MDKAAEAFRTISEVSELLETPAHVLRFWESRFPQIRPVKRAGGRRYYRPADVALLIGIKRLLHDEGLTIRGVQKILREQGVRHVAGEADDGLYDEADQDAEAALEEALKLNFGAVEEADIAPEKAESATIFALESALRRQPPLRPVEQALAMGSLFPEDPETPAITTMTTPETSVEVSVAEPEPMPMATEIVAPEAIAEKPPLWPQDADLLTKLRALPPFALHGNLAKARALHGRMIGLRSRMLTPPQMHEDQH